MVYSDFLRIHQLRDNRDQDAAKGLRQAIDLELYPLVPVPKAFSAGFPRRSVPPHFTVVDIQHVVPHRGYTHTLIRSIGNVDP